MQLLMHTDIMKTQNLKQAQDVQDFDAVFASVRCDEENFGCIL